MKKIIIHVSGGVAQEVFTDIDDDIDVGIIDDDILEDCNCDEVDGENANQKIDNMKEEIKSMKQVL